jgi:predicted GNAT superfamily acetyltransferase
MQPIVQIRMLESQQDMKQVEDLQRKVWPGSELEIVPAHIMLTIAHNGGVAVGAFEGDRLVGFVLGFLGTDEASSDRPAMARLKHCSHMLGVHPEARGRGIGFRLKEVQRQLVLKDGVRLITWTYDPLLSINAHLNIHLLGAVAKTYLRDVYGEMRDELNAGLTSDRFMVDWWITSSRVAERLERRRPPLDLARFLTAGAVKINAASLTTNRFARPSDAILEPKGNLILVEIPYDFGAIRQADSVLAQEWRAHARQVFEDCFAAGYLVTDFVISRDETVPRSYYLLSHSEGTLG